MLTSLLALAAVLVFYFASSKIEPKATEMFRIFSREEDSGFHSMETPPIPRKRLANGELYCEQERTK